MDPLTIALLVGSLALVVSIGFRLRHLVPDVRRAMEAIVAAWPDRRPPDA